MRHFMLIFRNENADFSKFSPKDFQELIKLYDAWTQKMIADGSRVSEGKLTRDLGKTLRSTKEGKVKLDGPFADSKEAIAGISIIKARDLESAVEIARGCPGLTYGASVEIREVEILGS